MKRNNEDGFKKLNTKLVISYLVLSFCIIFLLNIVMYFMIGKETYKDYVSASKREIIQIDNGINRYIKTLEQNIKMFSQSELLKGVNSKITSYINLKGINGKIPMEPLKKRSEERRVGKECR